jgi:hypothetical protein
MFLLKFQTSSAFGPRQYAESLALQKKIHCLDQSVLTILRKSGISMNLHKLNCPIFSQIRTGVNFKVPWVTVPYLYIKRGIFIRKRTLHFAETAPIIIIFVEIECTLDIQP